MVGWGFLFLGFLLLLRDVFGSMGTDHGFNPLSFAAIWDYVSTGASDDFQSSIITHYGKAVWWPFSIILNTWAFVEFLLIGFALEISMRERTDKSGKRVTKTAAAKKR
jgi:hypothetical protein